MSIGIIIGALLFILTIACLGLAVFQKSKRNSKASLIAVIIALVFILLFVTVPFSFHTVDTGEVAVVKYLGEAKNTRTAGTYFDFWLFNTYEIYDAKVQNVEILTAAYSSDAQTMDVAMTLQYQIMPDKVIEIAKQYGTEVLARIPIDPMLASLVDGGMIEAMEADYLEGAADLISEKLG